MKLLVVLQSHSITDNQKETGFIPKDKLRYPGVPKSEVSKRCINSLVSSLNYLVDNSRVEVYLQVYDDHSTEDFVECLKDILLKCKFQYNLDHLESTGIHSSFDALYNYGKLFGEDLVYFPQDDYLHEDTCFVEMIDLYLQYKDSGVGKSICIYPFNDPYRYYPQNIVPVRIVQGMNRHWRTSYQTASCLFLEHKTLVEEWDLFESFYNHPVDPKMEDDTINKLFQEREHVLFTPIPSLALHIQYETEIDPFIDWKTLWEKNKVHDKITLPEKVLLNVGSGKNKLNFPSFSDLTEVSYDANPLLNPDIVGDLLELDKIESNSVDVLWASHILEHIYRSDVPQVLTNIQRILKDDGVGIIIVPNIKEIADYIKEGNIHHTVYESECGPISSLEIIYGLVKDQEKEHYMFHKTAFTREYASDLLNALEIDGFTHEAGQNLFILITKTSIDKLCVNIDDVMRDFYL